MNVVDMHCDTIGRFYFSEKKEETKEGLLENSFQVDLKKMKKGKPNPENCVTLNLFVISMRRR